MLVAFGTAVVTGCGQSSRYSSGTNDAGAPSGGGSGGAPSGGGSGGMTSGGMTSGGMTSGGMTSGGMTSGGTASGAASNGGAGGVTLTGCGGFYTISVNALTGDGQSEYSGAEARFRDIDAVRELEVSGSVADEGGILAFVRLVVSPYEGFGTYTCSSGAATITTLQRCCSEVYDTRNPPIDECAIVVNGILSDELLGTFEGILHDENGGRMVLGDGRFCALIRD
jgi:hypothetical protein